MKYFHSTGISPSSHHKREKMTFAKNVKIVTRDLHHQHQQEVETAPHLRNDDYDEKMCNEQLDHTWLGHH
jgi:hypothetical protein